MSSDYSGLTRNIWPGTWSSGGSYPIVLDTEVRGTLQSISGNPGDQLTDITGQRLTEGMLVYLVNGYVDGLVTRTGNTYYKYNLLSGEFRDPVTGEMPNSESNWTVLSVTGSSGYSGGSGYSGESGFSGYSGIRGDLYKTTSTTSNSIVLGLQTYFVDTNLAYTVNQTISISYDVSNYMDAMIVLYNSNTGQ